MSRVLSIQNRQRIRSINIPLLRRITRRLLTAHLAVASYELGLHLVDTAEMTRVNEQFLQHRGSTDVITFDHNPAEELPSSTPRALHGELFLSIRDAVTQARAWQTHWQKELVRYIVHGLLHLCGHDDRSPAGRSRMKRVENRLVDLLRREFPVHTLSRAPRRPPRKRKGKRTAPTPLRRN